MVYYDGGCSAKLGTGGYIGWRNNACIGGEYKYYGSLCNTNNQAECKALIDALNWIVSLKLPKSVPIVLRGDSNLIYSFMTGQAKPTNSKLVEGIHIAKTIVRNQLKGYKIHF